MRIDPQVSSIKLIDPRLLLVLMHADNILGHEIVITSLYRPPGPKFSYHQLGLAADISCNKWGERHDELVRVLQADLGRLGVDVVHETPGVDGVAEHVHIEVDLGKVK